MEDKMLFIAIFSGAFCGIGLIFLMVSWIITAVVADKKKNCTYHDRNSHARGFHPVVQYTTDKGETLSVTSAVSTSPPKYKVGDIVNVKYDPNKPEKFYIDGDNTINIVKIVFLCVGLGLIVLGLLVGILVFIFA